MKHFSRAALIAGVATVGLMAAGLGNPAQAANVCPNIGADTNCGIVITLNPSGPATIVATGQGPYDGVEDTLVGIVNNSGASVAKVHLSSATLDIGGFDGDGIDTYGATGNGSDTTGYGGPQTFYTANLGLSLDANFVGGLANGSSTYFSLEEPLSATSITVGGSVPEPASLALLGSGLLAFGVARRRKKTK